MTRDDDIFALEYYKLHFASNETAIEAFNRAIKAIEQIGCLTDRPCDVCRFKNENGCNRWECVFKGVWNDKGRN